MNGQFALDQDAPRYEHKFLLTRREERAVRAVLSSMRDTYHTKQSSHDTIIDCIALLTVYANGYINNATRGQALATAAQATKILEELK